MCFNKHRTVVSRAVFTGTKAIVVAGQILRFGTQATARRGNMALQIFDQRMQRSLIDKLDTARGSAAFVWLVMDYMAYLRLTTQSTESWDRKKEMEVATRFVGMINNDVAWPLAEQVVPEFRRER